MLLSLILLTHSANGEPIRKTKQVLILITGQKDVPGYILAEKGMRAAFDQHMDFQFEYFVEHMDRFRFSDAAYQKEMFDLYQTKYSSKKLDLVIAYGYFALEFAAAKRDEIFPNTPVVFSAIMDGQLKQLNLNSTYTGCLLEIDSLGLLKTVLQNHPDTRHIAIISGSSKIGRLINNQTLRRYAPYSEQYEFISLGHLSMDDLLAAVAALPEKTVIIYYYMALDGNRQPLKPLKVAAMVSEAANVPVYGMADTYLGQGVVGGTVFSYEAQGRRAGEIGLRVLKGEKPADIPVTSEGTIVNMFDWRQLKRWEIPESKLPEGSIIRYREWSRWELYRWYIIGFIGFVVLQGVIIFVLASLWKKTQLKEQQLRYSHDRFKLYMENSVEGIWCLEFDKNIDINLPKDEQFELVYKHAYLSEANDAYARTVGLKFGRELVGARLASFCPRSEATNTATVKNWIEHRYLIKNAETVESYVDGVTRNIINNATPIIFDGCVNQVWGTHLDITDLKMTEQKLKETKEKYRTIADYTYGWEYWKAPDDSLIYTSPSCERITGYSVSDFMARPSLIHEIIIPEDKSIWDFHIHNASVESKENSPQYEFRIMRKDGGIRWIAHICHDIYDERGENAGVRASNRDITELKKTEQKVSEHRELLSRIERKNTLGQLTGSIAHELNQPLTGILSSAQAGELILAREESDKIQIVEILGNIIEDTKRASLVLKNLRALFIEKKEISYDELDINALIRETMTILNSEFVNRGLSIHMALSPEVPNVTGNRVQLQQVLINLIKNSWQAFQESEKLKHKVLISTSISNGNRVTVCIEDNGPGIDPDKLHMIFEPLVTTKRIGMGMGLSISNSIIKAHGGRLWAENDPQGGARMYFSLKV